MLVLTRKLQHQIKIGDQITVTILKVKGSTVRVGITAPREVRVIRGELPKDADNVETTPAMTAAVETVIAAGNESCDATEEIADENVISFRVRCATEEAPAEPAETSTQVSAAHLPLRRVHDRFGSAPLKHLLATCATAER
ncbi:MAG: carbon storage regulator [Planctomycetia bacterium]|nr:carbon storage regulator [Planctomycetia bacterium]